MKALQFPLIKITFFFIFGIGIAFYFRLDLTVVFYSLILALSTIAFFLWKSFETLIFGKWFDFSACVLAIFIGISTQCIHNDLSNKNNYSHFVKDENKKYQVRVCLQEKLKFSKYNDRFIATIHKIDNLATSGKLIINIRKDSLGNYNLQPGNVLQIKAEIIKNKSIKNPNQFDYGKYLANQNIFAQVYCNEDNIKIAADSNKNIWYYTAKFRNQIIKNLQKSDFGKDELAVIVALILGQQQDISPEILQDYQYAGAVHILSVSGLHVGFILIFIGYLLKPFPNTKKWKINKLLIVIISLWLFGFIAGLAPSVLRSVVMFTFVAIGRYLGRGVNIYNTLLVSALIILLFKPSFLFDVGFQLSYISLFFIIWLQPVLAKLWQPKSKITVFFWDIITVSFAAQIGAMGLSIYYFHQFPGLFFITNLIVLPFMGFILGYGVFIMILAFFNIAPAFLIKILEYSVLLLNWFIAKIAHFEQFIFKDISLNKAMLVAIYLMIIWIVLYFKKPKFNQMVLAIFSIIIFQATIFGSKYYHQNQTEFIVFNEKKNSIFAKKMGSNVILYDNIEKRNTNNNNLKQYLVANFCKVSVVKNIPKLLYYKNQKILFLDSMLINPVGLNPDILIITNSPKLNLDRFLHLCKPKIIVADGSNFKSYVKVWQKSCEKIDINFYSTTQKGFFRIE